MTNTPERSHGTAKENDEYVEYMEGDVHSPGCGGRVGYDHELALHAVMYAKLDEAIRR